MTTGRQQQNAEPADARKRKFRMVALDLDGTLLNSDHEVSDATVRHLRGLHSRGFVVAIATGRSAACAARVIERLGLAPPAPSPSAGGDAGNRGGFPLVCTNGARGLRIVRGAPGDGVDGAPANPFLRRTLVVAEELFHDPLPAPLALRALALARRLGCVTNYYHGHQIYAAVADDGQRELTERYARLTGSAELYRYLKDPEGGSFDEGNAYGYRRAMELGPPSKLLILCDTERLDEITDLVRGELGGGANVVRGSPPFFVEVLSPSVHKGEGLRRLCQSLSVPLGEVIAFGDGDNDLEFVRLAGRGVAMRNARDVLKQAADEVAGWSNDQDGVMKMLYKYEQAGELHFPQ